MYVLMGFAVTFTNIEGQNDVQFYTPGLKLATQCQAIIGR